MKFNYFFALLLAVVAYSCDDSTPDLGGTVIPEGDYIFSGTKTYQVKTKSLLMDSIYARTSTAYLGKYTDSQYGEFTADFLAQFNCTDDFEFPDSIKEVAGLTLFIQYSTFFGDSLNSMRMQIDTLDRVIPETDQKTFYTNVDPTEYYNENVQPITSIAYSALGVGVNDTTYNNTRLITQSISLPKSLADHMYNKYIEDKNNYKDAEAFIKNVIKGMYVQCTHGDGTILYIDNLDLRFLFKYLIESSTGKIDSLVNGYADFAATKEVIQANRFSNSDRLKELAADPTCTYLKTPAGIVTEATLPIEEIYDAHLRDTLNAASITFTRYTEEVEMAHNMPAPNNLLMLRKSEMYTFFEENKDYDNITSFLGTAGSGASANEYSYTNIAQLITTCINEKNEGVENNPNWLIENPDWNKVVLIPVTQGSGTAYQNSLQMQSTRLKGGSNGENDIDMKILYTTFENNTAE
ncbi:MAG: DUF4270 domain-containing protein [Phocaeicola sp.]